MFYSCKVSFLQVGIWLVLMFSITCSTGTRISLENRFEELERKLETKVSQLEEKVTQLETKNVQLENKVKEQETILISLIAQINQSESAIGSKSIANNGQIAIQPNGKSGIPRTCRELRTADPSLPSGMHWIDPDGQGVGDDPIYVYCDMTSGSTSIPHDSESPINVGHCADPGCYSRSVIYNASIKQIKALTELSAECHQSIKYECFFAAFDLNSVAYAWWNDRDGNAQYFWAGNNTDGIHTCQCGINGNCVDSAVKCNCDTLAPVQLVDDGVVTDKNVLPVTRLNFGRTQLETSSGIHTLGRFECSGTVSINGLPTSCRDLWLIGHTLNGFYFIKGAKMMESVYCDFTKLPDDAGFQKLIGYTDVKSAPVHFYVQRISSFNTTNIPIPFQSAVVNNGNAMDLASGIFMAPRTGIYFFSFTGQAQFPYSSSTSILGVNFVLNGNQIGLGFVEDANTVDGQRTPLTIQSTLNLKKGDKVWVQIGFQSTSVRLADNVDHYTHFTGFMLEEEIVDSF